MKDILIFIASLTLALSACTTGHIVHEPQKVGFIGPLSGGVSEWGIASLRGMQLAAEHTRIVAEDGKCKGPDAITAFHKLADLQDIDMIFVTCSAETMAIAPLAAERGVTLFSGSTIPAATDYSHVYRVSYSDADIAATLAGIIASEHDSVGIIYEETAYPAALKDAFLEEYDGEVYIEGYPQGTQDFRTQVTKLIAQDPDAIFIDPDAILAGLGILKQLHELDYDGALYGNYFGSSSTVQNVSYAQGLTYVADPDITDSPLKRNAYERYFEEYGDWPTLEFAFASGHDAMIVMEAVIDGVDIDSSVFTGILGRFTFDGHGDMTGVDPSVKRVGR